MTAEKSYLCPLFWQHHEDKEILRRELRQMKENGIGGFIAESSWKSRIGRLLNSAVR